MFFKTSDFNPSMLCKWALSLILPLGVYLLARDGSLSQPMMALSGHHALEAVCAWAMDTLNKLPWAFCFPPCTSCSAGWA